MERREFAETVSHTDGAAIPNLERTRRAATDDATIAGWATSVETPSPCHSCFV